MILIPIVIKDGYSLCDGQTRVVLCGGDDCLELCFRKVIVPILPEARASNE